MRVRKVGFRRVGRSKKKRRQEAKRDPAVDRLKKVDRIPAQIKGRFGDQWKMDEQEVAMTESVEVAAEQIRCKAQLPARICMSRVDVSRYAKSPVRMEIAREIGVRSSCDKDETPRQQDARDDPTTTRRTRANTHAHTWVVRERGARIVRCVNQSQNQRRRQRSPGGKRCCRLASR